MPRLRYRNVTILKHPRRDRFVVLCPFTDGVWGPYRTLEDAQREIRAWGLTAEEVRRKARPLPQWRYA